MPGLKELANRLLGKAADRLVPPKDVAMRSGDYNYSMSGPDAMRASLAGVTNANKDLGNIDARLNGEEAMSRYRGNPPRRTIPVGDGFARIAARRGQLTLTPEQRKSLAMHN